MLVCKQDVGIQRMGVVANVKKEVWVFKSIQISRYLVLASLISIIKNITLLQRIANLKSEYFN